MQTPLSANLLSERLNKVNWSAKQSLYDDVFERAVTLREVADPELSVVVISWRLHPDTKANLAKLQQQREHARFEVIFVDNGGQEGEFESLLPYIDTYIRLNRNTGAYLARNVGAVFCSAPILMFLEDDGIPDDQLIVSHLLAHRRFDVIAVRGVYLPKTENPLNDLQSHYYLGSRFFPYPSNLEGNSSYLSSAFYAVGGWDDQIVFGGGGPELAIRLLRHVPDYTKQIYSPISIIFHDYASSETHLKEKWKKQERSFQRLLGIHPDWRDIMGKWKALLAKEELLAPNPRTGDDPDLQARFSGLRAAISHRNEPHIAGYLHGNYLLAEPDARADWLRSAVANRNICIFGAGSYGDKVHEHLTNRGYAVACFADNNPDKWSETKHGVPVVPPEKITEKHYIFVASTWYHDIIGQLESLGFARDVDFTIVR